ncbi:hypothetical protein [Flavobacterium aurantiibacter]|uniref:Uncharacterized protein n=1 Tax=Flavobacterium aurantiibacter TaxID=2023067 RepID=A0A255ZQJ8_9FLAO|nr:hypothetical protein [Flavobacterium aurantiibacter]OYQ43194.1 hypothetical protein CHX27_10690 [Flavobacterium aurantiibacter]
MKKIQLFFLALSTALTLSGCETDGGDSKLNLIEAAVPDITINDTSDEIINLVAVTNGGDINLSLTLDKGFGKVSSMDVVLFYYKSDGSVFRSVLQSGITEFPATVSITKNSIFDAFEQINVPADFEVGDELLITADLTLPNGTVIKMYNDDGSRNFGANVANSAVYSVSQSFLVSCPSDLGGTYNYSTTDAYEPGGASVAGPITGTVTFTAIGGGAYEISDASFGGWEAIYGPGNISEGVTLVDVCNTIQFGGNDQFGDTYTMSNLVVNGASLSFSWTNTYGEGGEVTLTRPDGSPWPPLSL